ncbi:MAG: GNAT family N-acetyltransferase [Oscillospiraceae bacterium]|nr:GNAT family N-acetyltransferase [Oscillospiraceae bacterium]
MKIYKTLPNGIKIVEYDESLAPAIADMWNRSGEGWGGRFGDGIWTRETAIAQQESDAYFNIYLALDDDEVLGYCSLKRYWKDENTAYVQLLSVRPDCHGKGIGKELILMSLERTIQLGMPRLDLHTWPGNTKAMPMYKKCGFMWEDRSDTTLLSNFIPTVLDTELFKEFFEKADWYADSTREIDIEVDGVKKDKFELYEYKWEKGEKYLTVGFEKSGRRIRLIDTENYKIELTAADHEAAFGASYPCVFEIVNKKTTPLTVTVGAKNDEPIAFSGSWEVTVGVNERKTIEADFHVGKIEKEFDAMRVHPAVLADVYIDGKHAEFGLGIEPKFPVEVSLRAKSQIAKPKNKETYYISIKNNLSKDSTVSFSLPDNKLTHFETKSFSSKLEKGKDVMLKTEAEILSCGYEEAMVEYEICCGESGETTKFEKPLFLVNQGLSDAFYFETDKNYGAANGLWQLAMSKEDNDVVFDNLSSKGHVEFTVTKLGMPLEGEFDTMGPAAVRTIEKPPFIKFEADFASKKFEGVILTEIYEFDQAGTLRRSSRITNTGQKPQNLSLQHVFWTSVGRRAIFHYDGDFHSVDDSMLYGYDSLSFEKIDENWVFDQNPNCPTGICWPKQFTPKVSWGDELTFTFPIGEVQPGESFESEPYVLMFGVFKDFNEFRNYVMGESSEDVPITRNHLEPIVNAHNPVISKNQVTLALQSNRQRPWEGTVGLASKGELFEDIELAWQFDDDDDNDTTSLYRRVSTDVTIPQGKVGISEIALSLNLSGYEKEIPRTILITDGTEILCEKNDNVLTVTNGKLSFSASPKFMDTVHTMTYEGREWIFSGYPKHEPYSWYNPFIGGIKTTIKNLGNRLTLREKITAEFAAETDSFGNLWRGMRLDVEVKKHDKFSGISYSQYFLTLPGVPVLSHFVRVNNNTGRHLEITLYPQVFITDKVANESTVAEMLTQDGAKYRMHFNGEEDELSYDRLIRIERSDSRARSEKLYIFADSKRDRSESGVEYDLDIGVVNHFVNEKVSKIPDGETFTTKPLFCLLTEKDITLGAMEDFGRIQF